MGKLSPVTVYATVAINEAVNAAGIPEDQIKPPSALLIPGAENNSNMIVRETTGKLMAGKAILSITRNSGTANSHNLSHILQWHDGKEWDFVFDVDVSEGSPPLKLPMDKGEDPYDVAERFLLRHGLPDSYLEQVANFIIENTAGECVLLASICSTTVPLMTSLFPLNT